MKEKPLQQKRAPTSSNRMGAEQEVLVRTLSSGIMLANGSGNGKGELSTCSSNGLELGQTSTTVAELDKRRVREQWLREEIRANRTLMLQMMQWGVMTLAAVATALYYVRRDVANNLSLHNVLPANGTLPPGRWFVGTAFLTMIALIFCSLTKYMVSRHVGYRRQLLEPESSYSGIVENGTGGKVNRFPYLLYLAFPALDFVSWFYFRLANGITIPW